MSSDKGIVGCDEDLLTGDTVLLFWIMVRAGWVVMKTCRVVGRVSWATIRA